MADRYTASKERGRGRLGDPRGQPPGDQDTYISPIIKYFLFFFNFIFWLIGCFIIAVGIWSYYEKLTLDQTATNSQVSSSTISNLFFDVAIILMVAGTILFLIAFSGCVGALRESTILLLIFVVSVSIVVILEVAAAILVFVFSAQAEELVTRELAEGAIPRYRDDSDLQSLIDWFQETFTCCGVAAYATGGGYMDWSGNEYFSCDSVSIEACGVPYSCCKRSEANINDGIINSQCGYGVQSLSFSEASAVVNTEGCVPIVIAYLQNNLAWIGAVAAAIIVPQIITICLSLVLRMQVNDQKARWASA